MKRFLFYITGLLVLLQAASCVQETEITPASASTRSVQFHFRASAGDAETRALNSNEDVEVNNIYMLAFVEKSGVYEYAYAPPVSNLIITNGSGTFDVVLRVSSGNQKFLIIANPGSLATSVLPQPGETYEGVTSRLECTLADRWPANLDGSSTYTAIPMCANSGAVTIGSGTSTLGPLLLVRMLARIDVSLAPALTSPEVFKLTGVYLFRPYKSGLVHYNDAPAYWSSAGDTGSGGSITTAHALKAYVPTGVESVPKTNYYTYTVPAADKYAFRNSIYMFEALGVTDLSQATAIVIGGEKASDPGNVRYYRIDIKTLPKDATLPSGYKTADILRNFWYDIVINSVNGDGADTPIEAYDGNFTVNATVTPYNQAAMKTIIDKQYRLKVDPLNLEFDATASKQIVTAETNYNRSDLGFPAGIQVDATEIVYTPAVASGDEWITLSNENGTSVGDLTREIGVNVLANPGGVRSAKIYVKAGNMTQVVHIAQAEYLPLPPSVIPGGGTAISTATYVGAFWKVDQIGERLIRIPVAGANSGAWSVQVYEYGDDFELGDIVFSTANSDDGNVGTDNAMDMIANDAIYTVGSNALYVKGFVHSIGGDIFFRIGLKTKWNEQSGYNTIIKPARYATIIIGYADNTKWQKIYLRQGHEADYVMRDGDRGGNITAGARPLAVKYSPYNLTHPDLKTANSSTNWANITNHPQIPLRSTIPVEDADKYFADYPSQAGAFFQWAVDPTMTAISGKTYTFYERRAYHPSLPASALTGWNADYSFPSTNAYWTQHATTPLATANETCPPGWRRAGDGATNVAVSSPATMDSEMRQSLWLNVPTTISSNLENSVWGYYADGFYDRRSMTSSSTVANGSAQVAYRGRLFFNPTTNASLFIPAAGYRLDTSGLLAYTGSYGYCWTSSAWSLDNSWHLRFTSSSASQFHNRHSYGFPIRCVAE